MRLLFGQACPDWCNRQHVYAWCINGGASVSGQQTTCIHGGWSVIG